MSPVVLTFDLVPVLMSATSSAAPASLCSYNHDTLTNVQNIVYLIIAIKNTLHFTVNSCEESSKLFCKFLCVCVLLTSSIQSGITIRTGYDFVYVCRIY